MNCSKNKTNQIGKNASVFLGILMLAASHQAIAWSLFSPNDYEECEIEAAKKAKTQQALAILRKNCNSEFPARRKQGGGYRYYDSESNAYIDVSDPKLSKSDWKKISAIRQEVKNQKAREAQLARQVENAQNQRNYKLVSGLRIIDWSIRCASDYSCFDKIITATIKNSSEYELVWVQVGWVLTSGKIDCNANLSPSAASRVSIPPGQKATLSWETLDGPDSRVTGCLGITDAVAK